MPTPARPLLQRLAMLGAASVFLGLVLWASLALDQIVYKQIYAENILRRDWARMFRVCGYLPVWLLGAAAMWMLDSAGRRATAWASVRRGAWLASNTLLTGALAELLKLIVRRERPDSHGGAYMFRPFQGEWWSTSDLGFPSSHAAVAFAAACALTALFPRAWPVWLILALGCASTRILDRAHFLSDCAGSAVLSVGVAAVLMPCFAAANRRAAAR